MKSYLETFLETKSLVKMDSFIVISTRTDVDEWEDLMEYDYSDGRLWVYRNFVKNFQDLFPIDREQALEFIKNWFENKFDVLIEYTQS